MSLLLDAMRRNQNAQSLSDDQGLTPFMNQSSRRAKGGLHYRLPLFALLIGAAFGYGVDRLSTSEVTLPPVVVVQPEIELGQQILMPMPQMLVAEQPSPSILSPIEPPIEPPVDAVEPASTGSDQLLELMDAELDTFDQMFAAKAQPSDPELQLALDQVLAELGISLPYEPEAVLTAVETTNKIEPQIKVLSLGQLPWDVQKSLPDLEVTAHIYSTDPDKRWLRANGRELQEGDEAAPGLIVGEIRPNDIVLELGKWRFRIPALGQI